MLKRQNTRARSVSVTTKNMKYKKAQYRDWNNTQITRTYEREAYNDVLVQLAPFMSHAEPRRHHKLLSPMCSLCKDHKSILLGHKILQDINRDRLLIRNEQEQEGMDGNYTPK
ncbi:hypothetical protein OTU49_008512 [Cherax quadricarinatus]|uniref:Uncharacterized protein n=1 Tax=Cherax quadricarinatus TaxID=27406 RepID=A0AAW0WUS0_CHEQU